MHGIAEIDFILFSTKTCPNLVFWVILITQRAKDSSKTKKTRPKDSENTRQKDSSYCLKTRVFSLSCKN
jgi:hypothetical protein